MSSVKNIPDQIKTQRDIDLYECNSDIKMFGVTFGLLIPISFILIAYFSYNISIVRNGK